jgi:hypothetical protein
MIEYTKPKGDQRCELRATRQALFSWGLRARWFGNNSQVLLAHRGIIRQLFNSIFPKKNRHWNSHDFVFKLATKVFCISPLMVNVCRARSEVTAKEATRKEEGAHDISPGHEHRRVALALDSLTPFVDAILSCSHPLLFDFTSPITL